MRSERYVMMPAFSIAPNDTVIGIAIASIFGYGYAIPNQPSSHAITLGVSSAATWASAARPAGAMIRIGLPVLVLPASTTSNGPTPIATRYDGSAWVGSNTNVCPAAVSTSFATGALLTAIILDGTWIVSSHGTFTDGSSMHGKARRAPSDSNWVNAYHCW